MIRNKPHILKRNETVWYPSRLLFFDTETKMKKISETHTQHKLKLGVAIYTELSKQAEVKKREVFRFKKISDFIYFLIDHAHKKSTLFVFSCNVWFDLRITECLQSLVERGFVVLSFINRSRVSIIHCKSKNSSIIFLDTLNYYPFSVSQIGEYIGLKKHKVDFVRDNEEKLFQYCQRDVEIIEKAIIRWIQFLRRHNLGRFSKSLASQAFMAFRHRFMKHNIYIHHKKTVAELERRAYFGGRTECFYIGNVKDLPIYDLDVNSLYPYIMRNFKYPVRLAAYLKKGSISILKRALEKYLVIAEVEIETDKPYYPIHYQGKTLFPVGRFRTYLCTQSLKLALKNNHIKDVFRIAGYHGADIFSEYVDFFYGLKQQSKRQKDRVTYLITKLFLNSLYGKFGQRIDRVLEAGVMKKSKWGREDVYDTVTNRKQILNYLGNRYELLELASDDGYNTFIAISAHVTDYGRCYLLQLIEKAGWDNVYYCDTDSLFVNENGYQKLMDDIDEIELGKLRVQKKLNELVIFSPKDYIANGKAIIKGITKNAKKINNDTYEVEVFPKPLSDLRTGLKKPYITQKKIKRLRRFYTKGNVTPSGRVTPIFLQTT